VIRKRWLFQTGTLFATVALGIGVVGCGGGDDESSASSDISIGLVSDTGGIDDRGFNQYSIAGLDQAAADLGVETQVYVSETEDDYLPNLTAAAEDGHDLVIAVGYLLGPATIQVAPEYPDTSFAGVDHFYGGDTCAETKTCTQPNATGMIYPTEEAGYVAGVVAAMMSKSKTVSTVGGKKIPPVDNWIAGFQLGVKDTDSSVKALNAYSQDFDDQAKCREIALDQIGQGSDVIFQVAGDCGLAAIGAACDEGKYAIGVDADQSAQGDCVITSALKPLQDSVFSIIQTFVDGAFEGGQNITYGVADLPDAELLAPFTDAVPQDVQDAAAEATDKIKSGEVDPPATLG